MEKPRFLRDKLKSAIQGNDVKDGCSGPPAHPEQEALLDLKQASRPCQEADRLAS